MPEAEAQHPAWALWRQVKALYPAWNLWLEAFYTPGSWTMWGVDVVSGLRRNPSTRKTFALLEGASPELFEAVVALAAVNARRHDILFKAVLVTYITVPLAIVTTTAQITPIGVEHWLAGHWKLALQLFLTCTLGVVVYFWSQWRSKQILAVLDLVRIERGQLPNVALELREG